MGKPRLPSQKKAYKELSKRLAGYMVQVRNIYDRINERVASAVESVGYDGIGEFSFSDYPEISSSLQAIQRQFVGEMRALIFSGTTAEWKNSNVFQDLISAKVLKYYHAQVAGERFKHYFQNNSDQLRAFQARKERGLNLSAKLWKQSEVYKESIEATISTAMEKGMSAITLSKRLSKYLHDWPSLQADYQEKYGKATRCYDCEYRSIRLARNEINIAYRLAEQERWKQFDFVLGYKVKLSDSHPRYDICDDLQGSYPKDFKWTTWHPNCLCFAVPLVMSEDEYWKNREDGVIPNTIVTDIPENTKKWIENNSERIVIAQNRNVLPYWIEDNKGVVFKNIKLPPREQKMFVMSPDNVETLHKSNWSRFDADRYNHSALSGFNLLRFDKVMEQIGDDFGIYWNRKIVTFFENGNAVFNYKGLSGKEEVGLNRTFRYDGYKKVVSHDYFELPEELQGKGIAKKIFKGLFSEYERMGIDRVEVSANMDVGGYCWAKYGFAAKTSDIKELVRNRFADGVISKNDYAIISEALAASGQNVHMNRIADLECGKSLLLGNKVKWRGFINLKDRVQKKYLCDYIGIDF